VITSLEAYLSRPAEEGEKLTLERFPSGSQGFTTRARAVTWPCVSPTETHLLLEGIGETVRQACGVGAVEEVVMTRLEGRALQGCREVFPTGRKSRCRGSTAALRP